MRLRYYGIPIFALLTLIVMLGSCSDEWETHYNAQATNKSELNLFEYIQNRSDLTIFTKMLKSTGYDSILSKGGTFTVWAPNDDALKNITAEQLSDTTFVLQIVRNHITRFSYTTSGLSSKTVRMMDNKLFVLAKDPGGYSFGGKQIIPTESNLATANGILHIMGDYLPYQMNLWEYINKTNGLDSLRSYLESLTITTIDSLASYKNNNLVSYVYKSTNLALTYLGALNTEDSIYTAILPNNTAWTEAYNRILPYYNTLPADGGFETQSSIAKWTLIKDLVFRGRINQPSGMDSIFSTYFRTGFANPDRLFAGSQLTKLSNGLGYVTDQLKNTAIESWHKEIRIEAEYPFYTAGRFTNFTSGIESSIGTGFNVSNGYFLKLIPTITSTAQSVSGTAINVKFSIPNTLSAKYDIYCVFVPASILDTANRKPSKVKFTLYYKNDKGSLTVGYADKDHLIQSSKSLVNTFTTDSLATQPEEMLVASGFQFPYSNLLRGGDPNPIASTSVILQVNDAGLSADPNVNTTLLIDCIILKPVQ